MSRSPAWRRGGGRRAAGGGVEERPATGGPTGEGPREQVEVAVRGSDGPGGRPPPLEVGEGVEDQSDGATASRGLAATALKKAETALDGRPEVGVLLGQAGQRTEPGEGQGLGGVRTVPGNPSRLPPHPQDPRG